MLLKQTENEKLLVHTCPWSGPVQFALGDPPRSPWNPLHHYEAMVHVITRILHLCSVFRQTTLKQKRKGRRRRGERRESGSFLLPSWWRTRTTPTWNSLPRWCMAELDSWFFFFLIVSVAFFKQRTLCCRSGMKSVVKFDWLKTRHNDYYCIKNA